MGKPKVMKKAPKTPDYRSAVWVPVLITGLALTVVIILAPSQGLLLIIAPGITFLVSALIAQMIIRRGEKKNRTYIARQNAKMAAEHQRAQERTQAYMQSQIDAQNQAQGQP